MLAEKKGGFFTGVQFWAQTEAGPANRTTQVAATLRNAFMGIPTPDRGISGSFPERRGSGKVGSQGPIQIKAVYHRTGAPLHAISRSAGKSVQHFAWPKGGWSNGKDELRGAGGRA